MKNWKIATRLGLGFAAVLALLVALTVVGIVRMQTASAMTSVLVDVKVKNERLISEWLKVIEVNAARTVGAWQVSDAAAQKGIEGQMTASSARATEIQELLRTGLTVPESQALFQQVLVARQLYTDTRKAVFKAKAAGDLGLGKRLFEGELATRREAYLGKLNALFTLQKNLLDATAGAIEAQYLSGRTMLIGLGLCAVLLGVACAFWISRSITGPINMAVGVAERVSAGDLSHRIVADGGDETAQLMRALRAMNDNLVGIVGQVRGGTDTIATASAEIAAGNQDLSSRTEQQASSLEQTASSMEQLTATVGTNADNARQANRLAIAAAAIAGRGGAVVADVVSTMGSINDSSRRIVDIISVIDGIAFQTNILALNAAVEAARAGEQGRGFAVVASEVRNLAQRSAAAAKEIKGLIDDSVQKVETGSGLVDKAGHTMDEIVTSIAQVTAIMNQITAASEEQRAGIEQVNQAIAQMDQVTQQNAALVEQSAAAADAMQEQALRLAEVVGQFKLEAATGGPRAQAPASGPAGRAAPRMVSAAPSPSPSVPAATAMTPSARAAQPPRPQAAVARTRRAPVVRASTPSTAGGPKADEWEEF